MVNYRNLFYNKKLIFIFVVMSLSFCATGSYARSVISIQEGNYRLQFDVDNNRSIEISGLPFAGNYIYSASQGVLYVTHPAEKQTYFIALANLYKKIPQASVSMVGQASKQLGKETLEWRIKFRLRTCSTVYASKSAGENVNLNIADLVNINALISYMYAIKSQDKCSSYRLSNASGRVIGLPLWSSSNNGESKIVSIKRNELSSHILPKNAVAFNIQAKVRFMAYNLNKKYRQIFDKTALKMPIETQEKIVNRLLIEQGAISNINQ